MIKKSVALIGCIVLLSVIVIAQNKISIDVKESFQAGENITFRVSLYDAGNNPINADVSVVIEDAEKVNQVEKVVPSNQFVNVDLGDNPRSGYWTITAGYGNDKSAPTLFMIGTNEMIKLSLDNDVLTVTNIGNIRYSRDIQIAIGGTIGVKTVDLDLGEKTSFRLIAPDGVYNVRITDGKTTLTKSEVSLTGKAIGILDEQAEQEKSGITGVVNPKDDNATGQKSKNLFVYIFMAVVVGAVILLSIERVYRKRLG